MNHGLLRTHQESTMLILLLSLISTIQSLTILSVLPSTIWTDDYIPDDQGETGWTVERFESGIQFPPKWHGLYTAMNEATYRFFGCDDDGANLYITFQIAWCGNTINSDYILLIVTEGSREFNSSYILLDGSTSSSYFAIQEDGFGGQCNGQWYMESVRTYDTGSVPQGSRAQVLFRVLVESNKAFAAFKNVTAQCIRTPSPTSSPTSSGTLISSGSWYDDFAVDINGHIGWTDSNIHSGVSYIYHGVYSTGFHGNISRNFQCPLYSDVTIQYAILYDCQCETADSVYVFFGAQLIGIHDVTADNSTTKYTDDSLPNNNCGNKWTRGYPPSVLVNGVEAYTDYRLQFEVVVNSTGAQMFVFDIQLKCTAAPTSPPSFAPTPSGPTAAPTFSSNVVYIRPSTANPAGFDALDRLCNITHPCLTMDHGYECFIGDTDIAPLCTSSIYTGNGVIDVGRDTYYFNYILSFGNGDIVIRGQGITRTDLFISKVSPNTGLTWFECGYKKCWIGIEDLVLHCDRISTSDRMMVVKGGTIYINNVIIDGNNFMQKDDNTAFVIGTGSTSNIIFESVLFRNLDTMFAFENYANILFKNCDFINNSFTNNKYAATTPFILVNSSATVTITGCTFSNNFIGRDLFQVVDSGDLTVNNTIFINNTGNAYNSNGILIAANTGDSGAAIAIIASQFRFNHQFKSLLWLKSESYAFLVLQGCIFSDNTARSDVYFASNSYGDLDISDSQFLNGPSFWWSLYIAGTTSSIIKNSIWNNWASSGRPLIEVIDIGGTVNIRNVNISNIARRGIKYDGNSSIDSALNIENSMFYNMSIINTPGVGLYAVGKTIIINNTRFEEIIGTEGSAIYLNEPGNTTKLERLTFINNVAYGTAADLYIRKDRLLKDGSDKRYDISLSKGPYYVTGSRGNAYSSSVALIYDISSGTNFTSWTTYFKGWIVRNTSGAAAIFLDGAGIEFKDMLFEGNKDGIIYYDVISAASDYVIPVAMGFINNIFKQNDGMIIDFNPIIKSSSIISFDVMNIFDANTGGILHLTINDSQPFANYSGLLVDRVIIRNYNAPLQPLFLIQSSAGSTCSSKGIRWADDGALAFYYIQFEDNIDTEFIKMICVRSSIEGINITSNTMPSLTISNNPILSKAIFTMDDYSRSSIKYINAINNQGVMWKFVENAELDQIKIINHNGIFMYHDQQTSVGNEHVVYLTNITIQNCNSTSFADYGLFAFYGTGYQIHTVITIFTSLTFYNNTGRLMTFEPYTLETNTTLVDPEELCPSDDKAANILFQFCTFSGNQINSGYLIESHGVAMFMDHAVSFIDNICGTDTCLGLLDGWYTVENVEFPVNNYNFITFGHTTSSGTYGIQLCIESVYTPSYIDQYLQYVNLDNPQNDEKVTFLPCNYYNPSYIVNFLNPLTNYTGISKLDYFGDGSNILNENTVCNKTDCEIQCNGSISCFGSTLYCNSGVCNINCGNDYACTNIAIFSNNPSAKVSIICDGQFACSTSQIQIADAEQFQLICASTSACQEMKLNITGYNQMSEIYCQQDASCEQLTVHTENPNTTLYVYQYSEGITITNPFGYINDPDTGEQNLFCGDPNDYLFYGDSITTKSALDDHYVVVGQTGGNYPCDSITYFCNNYTNINNNCTIIHDYFTPDLSMIGNTFYQCYPTLITSLIKHRCEGNCPNSPTSAPTAAPSFSPTLPSISPTLAPSTSPTKIPSNAPVADPTFSPSISPTGTPTAAPTTAPTKTPSAAPTNMPLQAPTAAPTKTPSAAPTNMPVMSPTNAPTLIPTDNPTIAPSLAPSISPTSKPSFSPTLAPTRAPTMRDTFDRYIPITYLFGNLDFKIKYLLANNKTFIISIIQSIVERGYFVDIFLPYSRFQVEIQQIENDNIPDITSNTWTKWGDPLQLKSRINCADSDCIFIVNNKDMSTMTSGITTNAENKPETITECNGLDNFQPVTQCNLREYFNKSDITFTVENAASITSDSIKCLKDCGSNSIDYVLPAIISFLSLMALISMFAFLYNKQLFPTLSGFTPVDNAQWAALLIFGVQAWDFISDINLAIEIWGDLNGDGIPDSGENNVSFKDANILILIAAIGSSVSIILPYIINLMIAANIKKLIRKNNAAKAYFQYYAAVYVIFVVLSGGAYPALAVVSSNIFGLTMFNSGLTRYELKKLSKIKIFGTILIENLPQLLCQILYSYVLGSITPTTQLAFCASLLSVIASTLSYYIEKNAADTTAVQYYLSFQCSAIRKKTVQQQSSNIYDGIDDEIDADKIATVKTFDLNGEEIENKQEPDSDDSKYRKSGITEDEKKKIIKHKGLKWTMSISIAEVFGMSDKNIEIGYVQITKYGIIIHIVHYVFDTDLEELEEQLHDEEQIQVSIGPSFFTQQLYGAYIKEINEIFRNHYNVNNDFNVIYHKKYPKTDNKLMGQTQTHLAAKSADYDDDDDDGEEQQIDARRTSVMQQVLKKMKTLNALPVMNGNGNYDDNDGLYDDGGDVEMVDMNGNKENEIKIKLSKLLAGYNFSSSSNKKEFLLSWIDEDINISEEMDQDDEKEKVPFVNDNNRMNSVPL